MMDLSVMRHLMREWGTTDRDVEYMMAARRVQVTQLNELFSPSCTQRLTGMPGSGALSDTTAQTAINDSEAAEECRKQIAFLDSLIARRIRLRRAVDWALDDLSPAQRDTIRYRFEATEAHPYGMEWAEVAEAMKQQDERQVKRWEWNSLQKVSLFVLYYVGSGV